MGSRVRHLLIVGNGADAPIRAHRIVPGLRTTMLVRLDVLHAVREPSVHQRIIALRHDEGTAEWIAAAQAVHARDPFDRVASYAEKDQDKAAAVSEALSLPGHRPETVELAHDKVAMRERLARAGVDPTPSARVSDAGDVRSFGATHGYPVVLKPVAGAGSSGVSVIRSSDDIDEAWAWSSAGAVPEAGGLVVEAYLEGIEVSVEGFSEAGRYQMVCVTGKAKDPVHCVELGHTVPGDFDPHLRSQLAEFVAQVLDALGIRDGVTHTEVVLTANGPRLVETHLRPGGDEITTMVTDVFGVDLMDLMVEGSLGIPVLDRLRARLSEPVRGHQAIWFATPHAPGGIPGRISAVTGLDEVQALPFVREARLLKSPGARIPSVVADSRARALLVRADGKTAGEALGRARSAAESVNFALDQDG